MTPSEEYKRRRSQRLSRIARLQTVHIRLGNARLLLAATAALLAWESFHSHPRAGGWILVPVAAFVGLAVWHARVLRSMELGKRAVTFYERGLARIEDRWAGTGETGERFDQPHHVYASDLDLFGQASLFQLMSTARTRMGEETLANWLLAPAELKKVRERHGNVTELRGELDFREDLAVVGEDLGVGVNPAALVAWSELPNRMEQAWMVWLPALLAVLAVTGAALWAIENTATPFVVVVVLEAILTYRLKGALEAVVHDTEHAFHDLDLLSGILARVEAQNFRAAPLQSLQQALRSHHATSSQAIARLRTLVDFINSRHNVFVRIIDVPLMYSVQVAHAAERWRRAHGHAVRAWVATVGEVEALLSLATYSYEHPADPFPEFLEGLARFEAEELGHPLLPAAACVRNPVEVAEETRVLLVSGSNMSGKSTLLRAVGINTVLAMAGAPVRARRLQLTPLQVGASIRVNDSLQEGSSRFYAEITRLRQIFDLARSEAKLLFLLDELLQGTNSKDRRIGGEGIVRALVERGAIGLVSTHDLALADMGGTLDGQLHNVHFEDELANGKITFDYKLRQGVVTKSNGLELMRSIGLDV